MNDLVTIKENAVKALGSKAQYVLSAYEEYFGIAAEWEQEALSIVVTDETQTDLITKAKEGKKYLAKRRIDLEATRKKLKDASLNEGRVIDSIANTLKGLIEPIEKHLEEQAKFIENKEKERKRQLNMARFERIKPYLDTIIGYDFSEMSDELFEALFTAKKKAFDDKKAAEEALVREQQAKIEREKEEQRKMAEENAKLRKENEEKDRIARIDREKLEKKMQAELARQGKKIAAINAKAETERKAREALEKQLKNTVTCPNCQHKFIVERE